VHGEICPRNWIYHSIAPTFSALAAAPGAVEIAPGTHLKFTFTKHSGSFVFMSLVGDHPPTRKQPPLRTLELNEEQDYGVFCNMQVSGVASRASDCP
jgi:hypothetical protein